MAFAKVSPMKFVITQYCAKGLGNVSFMSAKGMFGLMKMDALIINPFEIDTPLFFYDSILLPVLMFKKEKKKQEATFDEVAKISQRVSG